MLLMEKSWQNLKLALKNNNSNHLGSSYIQDRHYDIIKNKMANFTHITLFCYEEAESFLALMQHNEEQRMQIWCVFHTLKGNDVKSELIAQVCPHESSK